LIEDLRSIVDMLADDPLGATRQSLDSQKYADAFSKITADPNQELTVVELNGVTVATFQLSFIQYLTHNGALRAQVEAVRTHSGFRGQGIGRQVFDYILKRAKEKGCCMLQLTTDKQRPDAIRFYESLGFSCTHEGMKMKF
jgi:GNAT superfamily N-acetyltransferase